MSFALTGEFETVSRHQIEKVIVPNHGGRVLGSVTKVIDILIVGRILIDGRPPETSKKY